MAHDRTEQVRLVLLARRDTPARRDAAAPRVRRYRLARVAIGGSAQARAAAALRESGGQLARHAGAAGA
jgi:hypothetical protein